MKNKLLILAMVVATAVGLSSCGTYKQSLSNNLMSQIRARFQIVRGPQQTFYDLSNGLQVKVEPTQPQSTGDKNVQSMSNLGIFQVPTITYVRSMGFKEMNPSQDYTLIITQSRMDVNTWNGEINIVLGVQLKDSKGTVVFNQDSFTTDKKAIGVDIAFNEAYTKALEQVNWPQIASILRVAQLPKDEPNQQVQGYGETALEQTIIRWDVQSRPQGADIFWRVVSKTPEVKSTNNKYLQTTPYEATKSLDIKGLTYQTSGDVRIILRCEKDGYHPQEKEYNVRMVIDQEEISAFFRLVKEGE